MKKLIVILLALMLVFSFTACGDGEEDTPDQEGQGQEGDGKDGGDGEKDKPVEISLMTGGPNAEKVLLESIVEDFEKEHPNIKVKLLLGVIGTEERKQAITTALQGKQTDPDLFTMDVAWIGQLAASGWLADLGPYKLDTSVFYPKIIKTADTFNGKLVGLPNFIDAGLLYYRTDLLEKYGYDGPPETWNELLEMALKVQEGERAEGNSDFWGYVWQGKQYEGLICDALEFFASAGGGFLDSDGNPILDTPENEKALQFMTDIIHKYEISPPNTYTDMREEESRRVWHFGNAMFMRNWPYAIGISRDDPESKVKGKFDIAPLPHFEGGVSAATLGGWHMGLSVYSDQKDAAVEFLKFYTSYEVQKRWFLELGFNPPRPALYEDEDAKKEVPGQVGLKEVFNGAIARPNVPYYSKLSDIMQKYFNSALSKSMEVEEALEKAQAEVESAIESAE